MKKSSLALNALFGMAWVFGLVILMDEDPTISGVLLGFGLLCLSSAAIYLRNWGE